MRPQQWKGNFLMLGQRKLRRHKSFNRVAAFTTAFINTPRELTGVRIRMAIAAGAVQQLLFEIAVNMTFLASNISMPAPQGKICHLVIERAAANIFPAFDRMALDTSIAKTTAMRVLMTWNTIGKLQAGVLHKRGKPFVAHFFRCRLFVVAFCACNILMPAGEHELRAIMRKFFGRFPSGKIMTMLARASKLPAMLVRMARGTLLRKAKKSFIQSHIRIAGKFFANIFRLMAVAASGLRMFAFQHVSGLLMIKIRFAFFPVNQFKCFAVMLAMARSAEFCRITGTARLQRRYPKMIAAFCLQPFGNRRVAF